MMAILRSRAEICITSTSILHLTSTSGSHADTREASHPHLFHASLLSRGLTCAIVHSQRRKAIQVCNVLAFLLCETSDVHIMWAFIRQSSKSEIDTICNPSSLFDRPPLLCETDSLRLWPDVCLSPSWRRKTQTGSYLMVELGGERRVWISRFQIETEPVSQWVEMSCEIGGANMVHLLNLLRDWHTLETGVTYMAHIG